MKCSTPTPCSRLVLLRLQKEEYFQTGRAAPFEATTCKIAWFSLVLRCSEPPVCYVPSIPSFLTTPPSLGAPLFLGPDVAPAVPDRGAELGRQRRWNGLTHLGTHSYRVLKRDELFPSYLTSTGPCRNVRSAWRTSATRRRRRRLLGLGDGFAQGVSPSISIKDLDY